MYQSRLAEIFVSNMCCGQKRYCLSYLDGEEVANGIGPAMRGSRLRTLLVTAMGTQRASKRGTRVTVTLSCSCVRVDKYTVIGGVLSVCTCATCCTTKKCDMDCLFILKSFFGVVLPEEIHGGLSDRCQLSLMPAQMASHNPRQSFFANDLSRPAEICFGLPN